MDDNLQTIIARINDAFYKLESYMNGSLSEYRYFDFKLHFTILFDELKKYENHNPENLKLINKYWILIDSLSVRFDRSIIKNWDAYSSDDFLKASDEIACTEWISNEMFGYFFSDEYQRPSFSISDIIGENSGTKERIKSPQKKTSYEWQNEPDKELPELYSLMIDKYKLIAPQTTLEQFKAIFTGQPIESINPIKWHQDNASELLYFIGRLEQLNNVVHNPKRADYQKMTACFVKPDGKPFTANWKQINQTISINLSTEKQKAIDELAGDF